ncbi:hypothetical protein [Pseudoalteromonas piscicida]|uniref:Uncharacterized protein n=1 Tax=Pseudoalteromonas piscicida TaxID=43662 RepID=A0AAD0RH66_PSEO7|nr:hypothetical protein [Pseudoalteromonas piscicida]ASD67027.1 hypothetical protein B1L02_08320 [Pseudoalteromonas piscicida]AXR02266.1 hypothetical protein D0511_09450 [Pseudoalteromonas piscicida]
MNTYILNKNKQPYSIGGNYELHNEGACKHLPDIENREYIGRYDSDFQALLIAKVKYPNRNIDGCIHCCNSIHVE